MSALSGSVGTRTEMLRMSVCGANQAALRSLVQSMRMGLIGRWIRTNAICPGPIDTHGFKRLEVPTEALNSIMSDITGGSPIERFGTPKDAAKAALFLTSDDAAYTVGEEIVGAGDISLVCLP